MKTVERAMPFVLGFAAIVAAGVLLATLAQSFAKH
jgi:hypothetical protein